MGIKEKRNLKNRNFRGVPFSGLMIYISLLFLFGSNVWAEDWPMFRHDPAHTGYIADEVGDKPELRWSFKAEGKISYPAIIANDSVLFISVKKTKSGPRYKYKLYCLDEDTGDLKWSRKIGGLFLAAAHNKVFVTPDGISCLSATTGKLIWKTGKGTSPPTVVNKYVLIYISNTWSNDETCCLNADNGKILWCTKIKCDVHTDSSPAVKDGKVFVCTNRRYETSHIYCLDERNGRKIWYFRPKDRGELEFWASAAVVMNKKVFAISSNDNIYSLDQNTGRLIWDYKIEGLASTLSASNRKIFVSAFDGTYCLDDRKLSFWSRKKRIIWKFDKTGNSLAPIVAGGRVISVYRDGRIFCLDANTGKETWAYKVKGPISSDPVVANNKLFICSVDGTIYCFKSSTGSLTVNSNPSGAKIYLNGIYKGDTPLKIFSFPIGNYSLKLSKPGYKAYDGKVHISDGKTTNLSMITLTRLHLKVIPEPILKIGIVISLIILIISIIVGLILRFRKPKTYFPVEGGYKKDRR